MCVFLCIWWQKLRQTLFNHTHTHAHTHTHRAILLCSLTKPCNSLLSLSHAQVSVYFSHTPHLHYYWPASRTLYPFQQPLSYSFLLILIVIFAALFNQTRRDYSFSFTYWSLTCNSFNFILVEWRGATFCVSCDEPLSLEHILLSCSDPIDIRQKYFNVNLLKVLFKEVSSDIIFNFSKQINIFYKL